MLEMLCYKTTPGTPRFWLKSSKVNKYGVKNALLAAAKGNIWEHQLPKRYVNVGISREWVRDGGAGRTTSARVHVTLFSA
jgi:hypothetical protein